MLRVRARRRPVPCGHSFHRMLRRLVPLVAAIAFGLAAAVPVRAQEPEPEVPRPAIGVRASFDDLILRARLRQAGWLVSVGENANVPAPLLLGPQVGTVSRDPVRELVPAPGSAAQLSPAAARVANAPTPASRLDYSPELETVFVFGGPGYLPTPPDYYFADGVYPVYDPPSFDDPSIHVRAVPRLAFEEQAWAVTREQLLRRLRHGTRTSGEAQDAAGITVTVPITMKGPLAEVFGRGATSLRVTGRENLSFGGESRKISPELKGELGRGQSLFPRLDMKQELQVKLEGTIGDKVHVQVDHNSAGFGSDANRINIYYQGYDDDIVQRVDLGGTNLALPGASLVAFSGGRSGLFGIKSELRLGSVKLNMVASKEEAQVESRSLTSRGGAPRPLSFLETGYARDRFFFYQKPDTSFSIYYDTYGIPPDSLLDESQASQFHVFVDTQSGAALDRPYTGFAVADLAAGGDTLAMRQAWETALSTARFPKDARNGRWKELVQGDDYSLVFFTLGSRKLILGFYLRFGAAGRSDAIGVAIGPQDPVGAIMERTGFTPEVRLRLIRHPDQDSDFYAHPSALYMMRHVYAIGGSEVQSLELDIVRDQSDQNPDIPLQIPNSTYLHMFGLDDYNESSGQLGPDGLVDLLRENLVDLREGLLYMPGVRPFSPPREKIIDRLVTAGIDRAEATADPERFFPVSEQLDRRLYTLPSTEPQLPHRYRVDGSTSGTETDIILPQDIIEGSEVVKVDGKTLVRGVDYDIENFAGGRIQLKGDALALLNPTSTIDVSYQFLPLVGGGSSTLLGVSGEYELGNTGRFGSVFLYQSTGSATKRVKFGEEPTRSMVADVNGTLRFEPNWMTRLINMLPFTNATNPSQIQVSGEVATSFPNPNTRNTAYVDDMEGADESDEQSMARTAWAYASFPLQVTEAVPVLDTALRVPLAYYNPPNEVVRGHLNPTLSENEINDGLAVLELGFDRDSLATLLQPTNPRSQNLWSGVMRSFGTAGLDLTSTKSIELWVNDGVGDPADRHGKMHIDFGDMSEDFILFPNPEDQSRFNREAPTPDEFLAAEDDLGWNGVDDGCDREFTSRCELAEAQVPFGSECFAAEVANCDDRGRQHYLANGTEGNNAFDTEDLNNNGRFDDLDSYFGITIDLADTTFIVTDVNPTYGGDASPYPDLKDGFGGWRKYRIDLDRVLQDTLRTAGAGAPNLRKISYLRVWFEDPGVSADRSLFLTNIQLYGLRLTRNQWVDLGFFAVDGTELPPELGESFSLGTINNKDDASIYTIPPDAEEIDDQGVQAREQSLRINVEDLQPGREVVAERQLTGLGRGLDFTQYKRMNFNVKANPSTRDTLEFFFRCGTDTLNYYEIAHTVLPGLDWQRVTVDLEQLTGLKFPEDYPGATFKYIEHGTLRTPQATAPTVDARNPDVPLRVTLRGSPSFTSITRFACGVRNPAGGFPGRGGEPSDTPRPAAFRPPASGEVWFNNVRLENPETSTGVAQAYNAAVKFSDVIDVSANYAANNSEFRSLAQSTAANADRYRFQGNVRSEISRLVPTAGFSIPVNYAYSRDRSLPKFFTQSDTRNTPERKIEQRSESEQTSYGFSITKRPSRNLMAKLVLDPLSFSYSKSFDRRFSYVSRDTSESRARSLKYALSPREKPITLWRNVRLNLLPTNISFQAQEQRSQADGFNVFHPRTGTTASDSLVAKPKSVSQSLSLNAATALRLLPTLNARYSFSESRDYRLAHPVNQAERFSILGYDFGLPKGRGEALSVDLTPRRFRFGYSTQFNDQRSFVRTQTGEPLPDVHSASTNRTARLQFDFGLHRRLVGWALPRQGPATATGGRADRPPQPTEPPSGQEEPPPDFERDRREDFSPPPGVDVPSDTTAVPPPPVAPPPGPVPGAAPAATPPATADSAAAPGRKIPNPLDLLRQIGDIEPVKVEYTNSKNAAYTGLFDTPSGAFRYGLSTASGFSGAQFETPPREDLRQSLDLQSGLPIRGKLRVGIRYKLDTSLGTRRSYETDRPDVLRSLNEDHSTDVTFPSLDLAINNVERIRLFGNKLERSNITFGYSRTENERYSTTQVPGGPVVESTGRSESTRDNLTVNWSGQWRGGVSTSLALTRAGNGTVSAGPIRSEGTAYQVNGTVRFKIAPKGGLQLPFLGSRGRLKSGMDVTLTASYNRDQRVRFNDPSRPDYFIPENQSSAISVGARGEYTLSRSMTGGIDLGYARNRNELADQTVTTLRLAFNITFIF